MPQVGNFVTAFNQDGRTFVRNSAQGLLKEDRRVTLAPRRSSPRDAKAVTWVQPKTFSHYVMNLPATAISFLDSFIGLYHGQEFLFSPQTETKLPMIHVHCFSTKSDDNAMEKIKICQEISERIQHTIKPEDEEVVIWDVRDVAPMKRMFCASFRLPAEVAFQRPRQEAAARI
jgi:tRNA (guanine37-N1)-methyltransferase